MSSHLVKQMAFALSICLALLATTGLPAERPANILVILVDDLGVGDLSSYGAEDLQSPQLDRLVAEGMKFTNFYANCPVCSPTRASLLTGRYPELVGVPGVIRTHAHNNWGRLADDAVLLPEVLARAGYDTAMVGKWHLGLESPDRPTDRGFQYFRGYLGDMMDDYYKHRRHGINYMRNGTQEIDPQGHATDLFSDWACDYLRTRQAARKPFFLYLAYNAPHTPIQPPPEWVKKVTQRQPGIDPKRARLVALIEHMDDGIGKVLETLRQTGLDEDTLIIFASDNGGQLSVGANNGSWRDGKQSMYEGGLRVCASATWPGKVQPASSTDRVALTMDIFATITDLANVKLKQPVEGRSFLPTLLGKQQEAETRDLFFHRREGGDRYGGLTTNAIRRGDWKLLQNSPFTPLELYNLKQDPAETTNLAGRERQIYREMSTALRLQLQRGGAVPWQRPARRDATDK